MISQTLSIENCKIVAQSLCGYSDDTCITGIEATCVTVLLLAKTLNIEQNYTRPIFYAHGM